MIVLEPQPLHRMRGAKTAVELVQDFRFRAHEFWLSFGVACHNGLHVTGNPRHILLQQKTT